MEPIEIARELYRRDPSAETFGIELVHADLDGSQVRMPVRAEICNGYGMIHGGMTFLLADTAMAFASCTSNETALATSAQVDWVAPARVGQTLTATARRQWSAGRTTIWDVEVTTDDGTTVAMFRGRTRKVGTPVID
jgi:acyl-CoA thioesterase